jgi:protein SCO1/2
MSKTMKRTFVAGVVALIASLAPALAARNPWGANYFPNLPVVTQEGKILRFYDDVIKDKIVVVNFIYTNCSDLCPIQTARLAQVKDKLGDALGRDVFFVSMSVDPEHDTPEMLKAFADAFGASAPGWLFLTGRPEDVKLINSKFGDRSGERNLSDHRNEIMIGNVAVGNWERDSSFADIDRIVVTIRSMDPKLGGQAPATQAGGAGFFQIGDQTGQAMFTKMCAPCHTIGGGDRIGPDLRGVVDRRDRTWLLDFIENPAKLLARKDPDAVALAAKFPSVRMPFMGLVENDASDVIAYLNTETSRLGATTAQSTSAAEQHQPRLPQ